MKDDNPVFIKCVRAVPAFAAVLSACLYILIFGRTDITFSDTKNVFFGFPFKFFTDDIITAGTLSRLCLLLVFSVFVFLFFRKITGSLNVPLMFLPLVLIGSGAGSRKLLLDGSYILTSLLFIFMMWAFLSFRREGQGDDREYRTGFSSIAVTAFGGMAGGLIVLSFWIAAIALDLKGKKEENVKERISRDTAFLLIAGSVGMMINRYLRLAVGMGPVKLRLSLKDLWMLNLLVIPAVYLIVKEIKRRDTGDKRLKALRASAVLFAVVMIVPGIIMMAGEIRKSDERMNLRQQVYDLIEEEGLDNGYALYGTLDSMEIAGCRIPRCSTLSQDLLSFRLNETYVDRMVRKRHEDEIDDTDPYAVIDDEVTGKRYVNLKKNDPQKKKMIKPGDIREKSYLIYENYENDEKLDEDIKKINGDPESSRDMGGIRMLIYDHDISEDFRNGLSDGRISVSELTCIGDHDRDRWLYVHQNGLVCGPYFSLGNGRYEFVFRGENLDRSRQVDVYSDALFKEGKTLEQEIVSVSPGEIRIDVKLDRDINDLEVHLGGSDDGGDVVLYNVDVYQTERARSRIRKKNIHYGSDAEEYRNEPYEKKSRRRPSWSGDYYGFWIIEDGNGIFSDRNEEAYDILGYIKENGDGTGFIGLADEGGSLLNAVVDFSGKDRIEGEMNCVYGTFLGMQLEEGSFGTKGADPSVENVRNMICFKGEFTDPDDERNSFTYTVYMRPWGQLWADVAAAGEHDRTLYPYKDMLPYRYEEWYLPFMELEEGSYPVPGGFRVKAADYIDAEEEKDGKQN